MKLVKKKTKKKQMDYVDELRLRKDWMSVKMYFWVVFNDDDEKERRVKHV